MRKLGSPEEWPVWPPLTFPFACPSQRFYLSILCMLPPFSLPQTVYLPAPDNTFPLLAVLLDGLIGASLDLPPRDMAVHNHLAGQISFYFLQIFHSSERAKTLQMRSC